jgi:V/A-type H+-transporting ATPase subunit I
VDYFSMREEKYQVLGTLIQSKRTFLLTGYVPAENAERLSKELYETCGVAVEIENLSDQEQAPVLLKNNAFTSPMESVVESFSLPGKGEIDPSSVIAFFFYFFFGKLLSLKYEYDRQKGQRTQCEPYAVEGKHPDVT